MKVERPPMHAWRILDGERATKVLLGPIALYNFDTKARGIGEKSKEKAWGGDRPRFWLSWKEKSNLNPWLKMRDM